MNLAERFFNSRFIQEPSFPNGPLSNKTGVFWIAEFGALAAISFTIARTLDMDVSNQIMYLPDFVHGRIHDGFGGFVASSVCRLLGTRGKSMSGGFLLNGTSEIASLSGSSFFGTYDNGDFIAFGIGALTWGTVDYLRARGMERFKQLRKSRISATPNPVV